MKTFNPLVAVFAALVVCTYFGLSTSARLKEQVVQASKVYNWRRIKRHTTNNTAKNDSQVQNYSTTQPPTGRTSTGSPTGQNGTAVNHNLTGLTEVQIDKLKRPNGTSVDLDRHNFPKIPNSHRGTLPPERNATTDNQMEENSTSLHESLASLNSKGNESRNHSLLAGTTASSRMFYSSGEQRLTTPIRGAHNAKHEIPGVTSIYYILVSILTSLLLTGLLCLAVNWCRVQRRGKLTISPTNGQRSPSVVYKA